MSEVSSKDVMALRNKTGLPMMDCKKALQEAGGDMEKAEENLRKKLKGKMDARTDRAAGQGRVAIHAAANGSAASIVEIRAETDFTASNEKFVAVTKKCAEMALSEPAGDVRPTAAMTALIDDLRITTGENCSFARGHTLAGTAGKTIFGSYVHHDGKTGVLIQAEGSVDEQTLRQVCMHVTAAVPRPLGITAEDIPAALVEKEKKFRIEQAMESGKPKEIAEKMVTGAMQKFYADVALLEQPFVMDPNKKVKDVLGSGVTLKAFVRWQVGEQA